MTPRYAVWQNAQQLPLFLQGERPQRKLARPAFDLVLRRIRSLKRCVQACGCKIMAQQLARRAEKTWKKKKAKPNQPESSQEPNQTSQKASQEPSQTSQKPSQASQKPARSQAKPARSQPKKPAKCQKPLRKNRIHLLKREPGAGLVRAWCRPGAGLSFCPACQIWNQTPPSLSRSMSYLQALVCLRWAMQLPWRSEGCYAFPKTAKDFKVTVAFHLQTGLETPFKVAQESLQTNWSSQASLPDFSVPQKGGQFAVRSPQHRRGSSRSGEGRPGLFGSRIRRTARRESTFARALASPAGSDSRSRLERHSPCALGIVHAVQTKCGLCRRERASPCPGQHRVPRQHKVPLTRAPQPANGFKQSEEHGLLLFAFLGILVAAHWAFLLRQVHGLLAWKPHKAFLFVDDLLCALVRDSASEMFALVVLFFCAIATPISWKKAQFQDSLIWCGWEINFSHDTIQLVSAKLMKLDALIKALLGSKQVLRKTLEQCIGLLIWATSIALHLRSWSAAIL